MSVRTCVSVCIGVVFVFNLKRVLMLQANNDNAHFKLIKIPLVVL